MGFFKNLFSSKPRSKLPRVDVSKRFELLGRTGQGSMSKVFRARDSKIGRIICLKILDKEKTAKFEARFIGMHRPIEGAICASLHHPNVVRTFEYGLTMQGEEYIVMELVDGMGLNFLIDTNSPHLLGKRIEYLIQVADGLEYVHQQGYLHRDVCPRNIMVTQEAQVKIIDLGLAVPYRPEFCKPGNRTGTPNYLAPELIKRSTTDHRIDIFALGVTAYELFTNHLPWEKTQSFQTLMSHMNSTGKNPRELKPDMEDDLAKFLIKGIERDPRDRFQSAGAFRDALRQLSRDDY